MHITKIPGFGRFGIFIDNIDLDNLSSSEWAEIAMLQSRFLLVILRNVTLSEPDRYSRLLRHVGNQAWQNTQADSYLDEWKPLPNVESSTVHRWVWDRQMWVSSILCQHNTLSSSSFLQTVDWYEAQSYSFKQELNQVVLVHQEDDSLFEKPLVVTTAGGDKGIHYSSGKGLVVKGMSPEESKILFDTIDSTLIDEKNVYRLTHGLGNNLCLVDNLACSHKWQSIDTDSTAHVLYHNFSKIFPEYSPFTTEPYRSKYKNIAT